MTEDRCGHLSILALSLTPAYTILYTEFTGAEEEKFMLNSASVNIVQGIQGVGNTSPKDRRVYINLLIAGNPLQGKATGLYTRHISLYSQKELLAMYYPLLL